MRPTPSILVAGLGGLLSGLRTTIDINERHGLTDHSRRSRSEYDQLRHILANAGYDADKIERDATEACDRALAEARARHVPHRDIEVDGEEHAA